MKTVQTIIPQNAELTSIIQAISPLMGVNQEEMRGFVSEDDIEQIGHLRVYSACYLSYLDVEKLLADRRIEDDAYEGRMEGDALVTVRLNIEDLMASEEVHTYPCKLHFCKLDRSLEGKRFWRVEGAFLAK